MGISRRSRAGVLLLAILSVVLAATACSGGNSANGGGIPPSPQQLFNIRLVVDIKSLDRGVLLYQVPQSINTGAQADLNVEVADIGRGANGGSPYPAGSNWVLYPQDVPTGGDVGLTATCDGLTCDALSQSRQAIPSLDYASNWFWQISSQNPGVAHIYLDATTYDTGSDIVLHQTEPPIEITVLVTPSTGYWITRVSNWLKALIGFVGFAALLALAQGIWRWRRKRVKRDEKDAAGPEPDPALQPAGHAPGGPGLGGAAPGDPATGETSPGQAAATSAMVPAVARADPLAPLAAASAESGTEVSSRDAAVLRSAEVTIGMTGQAIPDVVYLSQRMPYEKDTRAPENLNPVENAGYLHRVFTHAISVVLVWTLGTAILLAVGVIALFAFSFVSLYAGTLLIVAWSIVMAFVFWCRKLTSQLAAWDFLVDSKAGLAGPTFHRIVWAFSRRDTPVDSYSVRRFMPSGEQSRDVLEVREGVFHGVVSCFASGNDLYIGWAFWLSQSPARWLMRWLRQNLSWHHRRDQAADLSLRSERIRALREALHAAAREGAELAVSLPAVPGERTVGPLVPLVPQQHA